MYAMYEESSTTNSASGADRTERPVSTRPADLAQEGDPEHIPISASSYSNCEHGKSRAERESEHPALEESEFITHHSSKITSSSLIRTREGGGTNYGAITQGQGTEGGEDGGGRSPSASQERKQSAGASGGQAYDKIASRNKRAQHATTYASHSTDIVNYSEYLSLQQY